MSFLLPALATSFFGLIRDMVKVRREFSWFKLVRTPLLAFGLHAGLTSVGIEDNSGFKTALLERHVMLCGKFVYGLVSYDKKSKMCVRCKKSVDSL